MVLIVESGIQVLLLRHRRSELLDASVARMPFSSSPAACIPDVNDSEILYPAVIIEDALILKSGVAPLSI